MIPEELRIDCDDGDPRIQRKLFLNDHPADCFQRHTENQAVPVEHYLQQPLGGQVFRQQDQVVCAATLIGT